MLEAAREQPPYLIHRKVFAWTIKHDPPNLYTSLEKPHIQFLSGALSRYVANSEASPARERPEDDVSTFQMRLQALNTLREGVRDVLQFVLLYLSVHEKDEVHESEQQKIEAMLARVALLPGEEMSTYYHVQTRRLEQQTLTTESLADSPVHIIGEDEIPSDRGCPFAKEQEGTFRRDPLFGKFVSWSTALALEAYNTHSESDSIIPLSYWQ